MAEADWVKLFKQTFRFTGGEIVGEFLMSIGYLPGAHVPLARSTAGFSGSVHPGSPGGAPP
jgi:hypothetical protein